VPWSFDSFDPGSTNPHDAAVLIFFVSVMTALPAILEMQVVERNRMPADVGVAAEVEEAVEQGTGITAILQLNVAVPVMLGMVGALLLALPLSRTYSWTRRPRSSAALWLKRWLLFRWLSPSCCFW